MMVGLYQCQAEVPIHTSKPSTSVTTSPSHLSRTEILNFLLKTLTESYLHAAFYLNIYLSLSHLDTNVLALETSS